MFIYTIGHLSPEMDPAVSSAAKILFSKQGNYVQELLLDEAVRIADALSRSIVSSAVAAATQQPLVVGSLLLRSALIGGTASLVPKQLQSITSSLGKISGPLFPFAIAAQELEGVFFILCFLDSTARKNIHYELYKKQDYLFYTIIF
jgi:hypothetical protein